MAKQVNARVGFANSAGPSRSYAPRNREETEEKRAKRRQRDILAEAKKLALLAEYKLIKESGIDPNAEILIPKDNVQALSGAAYMILRFGCDGKNHVIAEELSRQGALYSWYGDGDKAYKAVFCTGKTKQQAKATPGVRPFSHRGMGNGLRKVHKDVLDHFVSNGALSAQNEDKILKLKA